MRDWINILGGLAIFGAGLVWLAAGGGWVALLVMLGGGYGASQASIRRNRRLAGEGPRALAGRRRPGCIHDVAPDARFCSVCGAPTRAGH